MLLAVICIAISSETITESLADNVLRRFALGDTRTVSNKMGLIVCHRTTGNWSSGTIQSKELTRTILQGKATQPKWTEYKLSWTKSEITKPQILRLVKQIDRVDHIDLTKPPAASGRQQKLMIDSEDSWHERLLNNALEIKIASNAKLYIYFIRESGVWRIYRVEECIH